MKEELQAVPGEVRAARDDAERKLAQTAEEHPAVHEALSLRLLLIAAGVAIVVAFALRVVGLGFTASLLVFLALFLGGWLGLAKLSAPRRPTRPARS